MPVEFGSVAGFTWEGVGLLDARLETVSVWEQPTADETDPFRRGVVYYLDEDRTVLGVLTVNLPWKMDTATNLVKYGATCESAQDAITFVYLGQ